MIKSKEDLISKLELVCEKSVAVFVADVTEKLGKAMYFEVLRGGNGNPYELQIVPSEIPNNKDGKQAIERQRVLYEAAKMLNERKHLRKIFAGMIGAHGHIFVNSNAETLARDTETLVNAIRECCRLLDADPAECIE